MNKVVEDSLTELFMHLADAVDGDERLPAHVRKAYLTEFKKPEVQEFYLALIEANTTPLDAPFCHGCCSNSCAHIVGGTPLPKRGTSHVSW